MIKFKVSLPAIAENEERCHPDCKGSYSDHDGDMWCHYFDDNLEFVDGLECGRCKECREQDNKIIMDQWVEKDVAEAVQRLGFAMLDFSIKDFMDIGFTEPEIASSKNANNPVFTIDLAIALLKRQKAKY